MALLSPLAGRLSDRVEPRVLASAGMAISTVGLAVLVFLDNDTGLTFVMATLAVLGLGFALFSSPNSNAVMGSVERRYYGVASGDPGHVRLTGQMFSLGIAMLLFALYMGQVQITPERFAPFLGQHEDRASSSSRLCASAESSLPWQEGEPGHNSGRPTSGSGELRRSKGSPEYVRSCHRRPG